MREILFVHHNRHMKKAASNLARCHSLRLSHALTAHLGTVSFRSVQYPVWVDAWAVKLTSLSCLPCACHPVHASSKPRIFAMTILAEIVHLLGVVPTKPIFHIPCVVRTRAYTDQSVSTSGNLRFIASLVWCVTCPAEPCIAYSSLSLTLCGISRVLDHPQSLLLSACPT